MLTNILKGFLYLLVCLGFLFNSACKLTDEEKDALDGALNPGQNEPPNTNRDPLPELCESIKQFQPEAEITKKIDILFMVDSSGSLNAERGDIGDGVDAFIAELPADVDFNIGVMVGHVGKRTGQLVRTYNDKPFVLKSTELSIDEIRSILRTRMKFVPGESESDGGEANLYSLDQALTTEKLIATRAEGLFREDAALAVVFVADENDICHRYVEGQNRVYDPDKKELPAFDKYCSDVTPEIVYEKLKAHQGGKPLLISGIIYNEDSVFPNSGENEIGWGMLDTIRLGNGLAIDLAGGHLHEGLAQIGTLATKKLNLQTEFALPTVELVPDTIDVEVDGEPVPFEYKKEVNEVHLTGYAGVENSEVFISYCREPEDPKGELPIITNLNVSNITDTTAIVTWDTDLPSSSKVAVTRVVDGFSYVTFITQVGVTRHTVFLVGLDANTVYQVRGVSQNQAGVVESAPATFRTKRAGGGETD